MITAEYTISYADYKAALRLYYRHRPWAVLGLAVIYCATALFVVLLGWGIWVRMQGDPNGYPPTSGLATNGWIAYNAAFAGFFPWCECSNCAVVIACFFLEARKKESC